MEDHTFTTNSLTKAEFLRRYSFTFGAAFRFVDHYIKSMYGATFKVKVYSQDKREQEIQDIVNEVKQILDHSALFNVRDRMLLEIFKNNGFNVVEFNGNPTDYNIAEYIHTKLLGYNIDYIVVNQLIYKVKNEPT